jgi:hypothetical protein
MWTSTSRYCFAFAICLTCSLNSTVILAQTSEPSRPLSDILVDRGADDLAAVKTWLGANIGNGGQQQPKYKSNVAKDKVPEVVLFEGEFMPQGDDNSTQMAVFSDDGVSCEVNGVAVDPQHFKDGQHLPDLTQSLHVLSKDGQPLVWEKGKVYRIKVRYSNIIHPDATDIDGCSLIAFKGGGNSVKVAIVCDASLKQDEALKDPTLQFSLEFTPAAMAANATAYAWSFKANDPSNNGPAFPYKKPTEATTGITSLRWYGHRGVADDSYSDPSGGEDDDKLRWMGNCMNPSSYELLCNVTFGTTGSATAHVKAATGSAGKYFYVTVFDAGSTSAAKLSGLTDMTYANDGTMWSITAKGNLKRVAAVISSLPYTSSQFYDKTKAHETTHKDEWETMAEGKFKFFDADVFYDAVKGFTGTSQINLNNKVIDYYNDTYLPAQQAALLAQFGTLQAREIRAYHSEYTVEPVQVRERSDTWIKTAYPN